VKRHLPPMKILYYHTTIWNPFFSDLLFYYQKKRGCRVGIICGALDTPLYAKNFEAGASHYLMPDLEQRQSWEDDSREEERLSALVRDCEKSSGKSISRMVLAAERSFGRAYAAGAYYWPRSSIHGACRENNLLPQRMVLRAFSATATIFDTFQPDLVLCRGFAGPLPTSAWMLAAHRGIPMYAAQFSKAVSNRAFWTDDYFMYNTQGKRRYREKVAQGCRPSAWALEQIHSFRTEPRTVQYIAKNWARKSDWIKSHRNFLGLLRAKARYHLGGGKGARPKSVLPKVVEYYRTALMERMHQGYFRVFEEEELMHLRYVYYPLHKEPELMLNFKAPLWHDQLHTIKYLSPLVPFGYRLLVREHRFNWGRRFGGYLRGMTSLPGVVLVHPFDPQFKYIKNADLVLTDNGSSGWEAILLGRSLVTLERTFYDVLPQANRLADPATLDEMMLRTLESPPRLNDPDYDRHIALFLDAEREHSLDIDEMHQDVSLSIEALDGLLGE